MAEQVDLQALRAAGGQLAGVGARLIRFLTTRSDVICVTLRRHEQWLAARDPKARLIHIPLGVYDRPEILAESGGRELLLFGNFAPYKGLELLLEVFRDLYRRDPATRLTIAGSDHHRFPGYLARVRESFGNHEGVRWLGPVPEPALRELFARATIVTLPYRASTGSSSVLYRAAGWGRPVVASDLPELRATADEPNLEVEFFRNGDPAGLKAALERLFGDPDLRANRARHNLIAVQRGLTLTHTSQAYLHAFDLALATHKSDIRIPGPLLRHSPEAL
jgi:glycosyltransferase involved in cell wall biosynthesis